ncbi:hypothetical protein [Flagellimonas oceanensis]|uniref:hypothetical protein n=1 Tax=Flagellimonas oceanensis TaxID=2499163 RepID=UPI003BAD5198
MSKAHPRKGPHILSKRIQAKTLIVSINWTDSENKDQEITYEMIPDGLRKKFENPQIAYEVMSEFTA